MSNNTILIVDDDKNIRLLLDKYLSSANYETVEASSGKEGIDLARKIKPDIVITDIVMPGKSGVEVIERIKRIRPDTKVIAISGGQAENKPDMLRMAKIMGASKTLYKPIVKEELLEAVKALMPAENEKIIVHVDPDLEDIIPDFLLNLAEDLQSILEALDKNDFETVRVLGHSMKGSGGGYGFDAVTEMGRDIENAAGATDAKTIGAKVSEIKNYLQRVEIIFE
ncbi:hypothetical protein MNBD_NITROSPINAE04-1246 [hydrothermal vent metagenome]|uniref:Response regulatory domain-containing protein n=1 Tax=hydrothermal vent metagenome TaxID=652676 RepID=A0A3B1CPU7_9ZZZZ